MQLVIDSSYNFRYKAIVTQNWLKSQEQEQDVFFYISFKIFKFTQRFHGIFT